MSDPALKQIICIKWGTAYSARYINVLHGMIARNITGPFKLFCFTDDANGIRPEVTCLPLPELGCTIPPEIPGKWRKTALWGSELFGLKGVALFMDVDSVIVGNIDDYFTYGSPDDVIAARNWAHPLRNQGQTSVFRFTIGQHSYMLDNLRANPEAISRKHVWEQVYVTRCVRGGIKFWPETWTKHFRLHCLPAWPMRYFKTPVLPNGAKIVTFPGGPDPHVVMDGIWHAGEPLRSPWEHIRHTWSQRNSPKQKKFFKELKSYSLPVPWLKEHWRE